MSRCLYCYKELNAGETDFHKACIKKFFGSANLPKLPYTQADIKDLAKRVISSQTALAGVQSKLSMNLDKAIKGSPKLTIVGLGGEYILKPQSTNYSSLPENESLSMHLARIVGINTVPFSLIRFSDCNLCYITKRIDRVKAKKLAMEDMAQLSLRLSEDKYKSSYEQIAKVIKAHCLNIGLDLLNFAEQILFSWLIGNSDMHLKNFSLIEGVSGYSLSPAYDMLNTKLPMPKDKEELALALNGKRAKLKRADFVESFQSFGLELKSIENLLSRFIKQETNLLDFIDISFLVDDDKTAYKALIQERIARLS